MGSIGRFLAAFGLAFCLWCARARAEQPPAGVEPSRQQCVDAHEQAQSARLTGQLLLARSLLRQCSAAACPALVSHDCTGWLAELEPSIPSVIFHATQDGQDLIKLSIREGERALADSLTGTPLELEPGPHEFVAELQGFPPQHATYVLQAGDKGRVVRFDFVTPVAPSKPAAPPPNARTPEPDATVTLERPIPTLSYVLGGSALGAAITGGVLGGLALSERADVDKKCAPLCGERDLQRLERLALAADISLGLALLSGALAGYSYAERPSVPKAGALPARHTSLQLSVGARHLAITAGGRF